MRINSVSAALILLNLCASAYSQVGAHCNTVWVTPTPGQTYVARGYEVSEIWAGGELPLSVLIKRRFDRQPILFYRHHRAIGLTLGHRKRLVLINDWEATKSAKIVVVDLKSGSQTQIDKRTVAIYRRNARPDPRLIILPEACGFSRDDKRVLIEMVMEYVSAATAEESNAASRTYRAWSYAVEASTGRVIREYRQKVPAKW